MFIQWLCGVGQSAYLRTLGRVIPQPDCSPVMRVRVWFDGDAGLNVTLLALLTVVHLGQFLASIPHFTRQTCEVLHLFGRQISSVEDACHTCASRGACLQDIRKFMRPPPQTQMCTHTGIVTHCAKCFGRQRTELQQTSEMS